MIINTILAILAWKTKILTLKGTIIALFLGIIVFYICIEAYIVLFLYFTIISITEKIVLKKEREQRTYVQVLSNFIFSFISLILYVIFKDHKFFVLYCSLLSVSICDTFASTIGTQFAKNAYSITKLKKIPKGVSGGVSLLGSASGALGSAFVALIYFLLFSNKSNLYKSSNIALIIILGVLGMLIDSILGDTLQKKFYCQQCKKITDHEICCDTRTISIGTNLLSNTQVNIISEGLVFIIGLLIYSDS